MPIEHNASSIFGCSSPGSLDSYTHSLTPIPDNKQMELRITEGKHSLIVLVKVADQRERVREQKGKRKGNSGLKRREEIKEETVTIVGAQDMQVRRILPDQLGF